MKIAVFGAAGRTGRPLVEQALEAGFEVVAFFRGSPSRIDPKNERLTIVNGDATDQEAVLMAVKGTDAVISVLATSASQKIAKTGPLTRSTKNIIAAMEKFGVHRLIICSSGIPQPGDLPDMRFGLLMGFVRFLVPETYRDTFECAQIVRESRTGWTIARMANPTNAPGTGRIDAGYVSKNIGMKISRSDAAAFMLNELKENKYVRQSPVIFNPH